MSDWPERVVFSFEQTKWHKMATSSGVTSLPNPVLLATVHICSSESTDLVIGVSNTPGKIALTRILCSAKSTAADLTRPLIADLATEYESLFGRIASCQIEEMMHKRDP
jgi:hypothetical protein